MEPWINKQTPLNTDISGAPWRSTSISLKPTNFPFISSKLKFYWKTWVLLCAKDAGQYRCVTPQHEAILMFLWKYIEFGKDSEANAQKAREQWQLALNQNRPADFAGCNPALFWWNTAGNRTVQLDYQRWLEAIWHQIGTVFGSQGMMVVTLHTYTVAKMKWQSAEM